MPTYLGIFNEHSTFYINSQVCKGKLGRAADIYPIIAEAAQKNGCWINEALFRSVNAHLLLLMKLEEFNRQDPRYYNGYQSLNHILFF